MMYAKRPESLVENKLDYVMCGLNSFRGGHNSLIVLEYPVAVNSNHTFLRSDLVDARNSLCQLISTTSLLNRFKFKRNLFKST